MNLEKFLWSKTKSDIIKYLVFKRQWVSMRALEQELEWTFPAIKKQIDSLEESDILIINKSAQARSIELDPRIQDIISQLVITTLKQSCEKLFSVYEVIISQRYYWKLFGQLIEQDLVILYKNIDSNWLEQIKKELSTLLHEFFIDHASIVFMNEDEFRKRINMADKFALGIIRAQGNK